MSRFIERNQRRSRRKFRLIFRRFPLMYEFTAQLASMCARLQS